MSIQFSDAEKMYGKILSDKFQSVINDLRNKNKINPDHVKKSRDMKRMFNFANQSALHINYLDGIVRIPKERKEFENKNKDFEPDLLDELWFDLLVVATLRNYWSIEMSLITLLKDVQYGKKGIVQGSENLGKLKIILDNMGYDKHIDWKSIDINFRNALAHGWYYRKKQTYVFYNNAKLKKGKKYAMKQLINQCKLIQLNALVISALVGKWSELTDFGTKDPLKKKLR